MDFERFSRRDRKIIEMIGADYSDEEMADSLGITVNALRIAIVRIKKKLELKSVEHVAEWIIPKLLERSGKRNKKSETCIDPPDKTALNLFFDAYKLTTQERNIAELVAMGFTSSAIMEHMNISQQTLKRHIMNIEKKLGVYDKPGIVMRIYNALSRTKQ